jgi:sugar lactone lactonase YvrE
MHQVQAYTAEGDLEASWGKPSLEIQGFCGCCNPCNIALLPDGSVVTAEKGIPRVKVYSAAGAFESVVAPPDALSTAAAGTDLVVDSQGRVLVLDPPARAIRVFAPLAAQATGKSVGAVTRPRWPFGGGHG